MIDIKYPNIHVKLVGEDGNAFFIVGRVKVAMWRAGVPIEEQKKFSEEALSGDYDNVLATCIRWVDCD